MAAPGTGCGQRPRRPAPLYRLGQANPDRLRRLPGVFAGGSAQDHRGWRHLRLAGQWRQAVPVARDLDADPAHAQFRHRHAVRRMHAVRDRRPPRHARGSRQLDAHEPALGQALARRVRTAGQPQRAVRHRPGRHVRRPARRVAGWPVRAGLPRLCHRRAVSGRAQGRHDAGAGARGAAAAGQQAALPDGRGHAGGPRCRGRRRRGHVRLRDADPQRAQRLALHPLRRRQDQERRAPQRPASARRELRLLHLPQFLARLFAPPAPRRRDPGRAPEHHPQPALLPAADARGARGDRAAPLCRLPPPVRRRPHPRHQVRTRAGANFCAAGGRIAGRGAAASCFGRTRTNPYSALECQGRPGANGRMIDYLTDFVTENQRADF
ncbi:hypothetical protein CBM2589_B220245 [Cupriavidus taiwanensis]|uniref:Uncharacterized protein n=1 Tax=Cupriavidus taiwanensis TaxID=164546 RepID=A0A975WZ37_9BURK|nr:hypothetical protein CBM2589_B220245 [Cupriavidus taiwanensis]